MQPVSIGEGSNLQDGVYAGSLLGSGHKTVVGNNVSVGHGATLRGCSVGDNCLIGMDCVLQEGSHVGSAAAAKLPQTLGLRLLAQASAAYSRRRSIWSWSGRSQEQLATLSWP